MKGNAICKRFIHQTLNSPDSLFIETVSSNLTYGEALSMVKKMVSLLEAYHVEPSDRVVLHMSNSVELICMYLACFYLGCVPVPVGVYFTDVEFQRLIKDAKPTYLVTHSKTMDEFFAHTNIHLPFTTVDALHKRLSQTAETENQPYQHAEGGTVIHYTSGSTGQPKGVVHRHLDRLMSHYTKTGGYTPADKVLVTLSLTHGFAFSIQFLPAINVGASLIILDDLDSHNVVDAIKKNKVTVWCTVPSLLKQTITYVKTQKHLKHSLRICMVGGDIVSQTLLDDFEKTFQLRLSDCWGLTEAFCVTLNKPDSKWRRGSSGLVCEGDNIKVSATGEIYVSGDSVMAEYFSNPVATREVLSKGWLRTGDYGEIDKDGYLYFKGRMKDILIVDGYNISPYEVEQTVCGMSGVKESALIGMPDPVYGMRLHLMVAAEKAVNEQRLKAYLTPLLSEYKIPKVYHFVSSLPKTPFGKIDKSACCRMIVENG